MPAVEHWDANLKALRHVGPDNPLPTALHYGPSNQVAVTEALVSSTRSSPFSPLAGRTFYMTLTGTGSITVTAVFSSDAGANYRPEVAGVDGGAPIVLNKVAYDGGTLNGVRIPLQVDQSGVKVAALPGVLTGAVTVTFEQ